MFEGTRGIALVVGSAAATVFGSVFAVAGGEAPVVAPAPMQATGTVAVFAGALGTIGSIAGMLFDRWNKRQAMRYAHERAIREIDLVSAHRRELGRADVATLIRWKSTAVDYLERSRPHTEPVLGPPPLPAPPDPTLPEVPPHGPDDREDA